MFKNFIFITLFLVINNLSKADDFYTVDSIIVDIVSDNIGLARNQATDDAVLIGFKRLLSWKLNREDFYIIETILNDKNRDLKFIKDYISGYKIHHEKFSNLNYRAKFSIYYDLAKIKNWLAMNNVTYYDKSITNILIIPIMELNGNRFLWDGPSLWSNLWQDKSSNKYINNFIFPYGDLEDVTNLSFENLYNINLTKIYNFSNRYELKDILVPYLYIYTDNNKVFKGEFGANLIINHSLIDLMEKQVLSSYEGEPLDDFIIRCKNLISNIVVNYFENNQIVNNITLKLNANYNDFENWLILKKNIDNIKEILEYKILSLSINTAEIEIKISINNETDLFNIFNNSRLGINKNIYNEYDISIISEDELFNNFNDVDNKTFDDGQTILVIE